jgi:predicted neuraminidase
MNSKMFRNEHFTRRCLNSIATPTGPAKVRMVMKAHRLEKQEAGLVFALILGGVAQAQSWTAPAATEPETQAAVSRFAAMSPAEISEHVSGLARQFRDAEKTASPQDDGFPRELLKQIADVTLIPPTINTNPLPEFDYDKLDYAMTLGLERTPGGRLWAAWVAGEDGPEAFMVAATSDDGGETWSKPRFVINSHIPGFPVRTSVIVGNFWTDPLGRLWFFFDQTINHYDGRQGLWASICENPDADEPEWSTPVRLWHGSVLNKPTVMSNGEWWLPVEFPAIKPVLPMEGVHNSLEPLRGANVLVSTDQGRTWELRGRVRFPNSNWDEHMFVELKDGRAWMLARVGDGENGVRQSFSSDGGRTWTEPDRPTFVHPVARFHVRRLASGRLLLIKHGETIDTHQGRSKLTAWLSEDEGKTWLGGLMLDERNGISYPDAIQQPDGAIIATYDRERGTLGEIYMARFREEDILARKPVSPDTRLQHLIVQTPKKSVLRDNAGAEPFAAAPPAEVDAPDGEIQPSEPGARIYRNRNYTFHQLPDELAGRRFIHSTLEKSEATCIQEGMVYVLAPTPERNPGDNPEKELLAQGFRRVALPEFVITLIDGQARARETCSVYQKHMQAGESVRFGRWGVIVF